MGMQLTGWITAGDELLDGDLRDISIVSGAGGTFIYAATGQNGGISVYQIHNDGRLASLSDTAYFSVSGMGVGRFDVITLDGSSSLFLGGVGNGGLIRYGLQTDGDLNPTSQINLPGTGTLTPGEMATLTLSGGATALYLSDADTGLLSAWVSDGAGGIDAAIPLTGPPAGFDLEGVVALEVASVGGNIFLLAADGGTNGVRSYAIDPDTGALSAVDSLGAGNGLGVAVPTAMQTVTAHGATWVVLAAAGSSSLSVMKLTSKGNLVPADHILDTLATRFGGVTALEVVKVDGHVFVLAGGADDGISLFSLLPDGRLVHMQTLIHAAGLGLENITDIEAVQTGTELQIFVTSGGDAGLSQFSLPLGDLGSVIQATQAGGTQVLGSGAGDLILGRSGQDWLLGQGGDDILVSSQAGGVLTGGDGADTFVLCPTTGTLQISDFEPGIDRLDLTQFPMLRSVGQLELQSTGTGIRITYGTTTIDILSRDGSPLKAGDLWPDGFETPDRVLSFPSGPVIRVTTGTGGDDILIQGAGRDKIRGLGGDDEIRSGSGIDRLFGGNGADALYGGRGQDTLRGGKGADTLAGGWGADMLLGAGGKDTLKGGKGNDILMGGAGNDRLTGGAGADVFIFGTKDGTEGGAGSGADRITDFTPDVDRIHIMTAGAEYDDLIFTQQGANTLIDTSMGTILLTGVLPTALSDSDFLFS